MPQSHDNKRAITLFTAVLEHAPGHTAARYNLGLAFRAAGEYTAARRQFEQYAADSTDPKEKADIAAMIRSLPAK